MRRSGREAAVPEQEGRDYGIEAQIACMKREIRLRERVYPQLVRAGQMSQAQADREIATMQAILRTLLTLRPQGSLAL